MKTIFLPVLAAGLLAAGSASAAEQLKSQTGYKLTVKAVEACQNGQIAIYKEAAKNARLKSELENMPDASNDESFEQFATFMKQEAPMASAILTKNGCSPDELARQLGSMLEAGFAMMAEQAGGKKIDMDPVMRENATFLMQNQAMFEQKQAEVEAAEKAAGLKRKGEDEELGDEAPEEEPVEEEPAPAPKK